MLDFQATRWGQGASYFFTFMALAIIIPYVSVYFQLCFVPFVVYILCVISYLQLTPGCISNKSNAECVFDYYVRADKQHKFWLVEEVFLYKWEVIVWPITGRSRYFPSVKTVVSVFLPLVALQLAKMSESEFCNVRYFLRKM